MTVINCNECGGLVSTNAPRCPHCGNPKEYFDESDEKNSEIPSIEINKKTTPRRQNKITFIIFGFSIISVFFFFAYQKAQKVIGENAKDDKFISEARKSLVESEKKHKLHREIQKDFPGINLNETHEDYAKRMQFKYPGLKSEETIKTYNKRMAFIKRQSPDSFLYPLSKTTFRTTAISDINLPDFNELDVKDLAPVVEAAAPTMSAAGMNNDQMKKAMAGIGLSLPKTGLSLPQTMQKRCYAKKRMASLESWGGKTMTEAAIVKGLNWLKIMQSEDGSWGANDRDEKGEVVSKVDAGYKKAMTGMALLCYLGHCELQDSVKYGTTVQKAINYLTSMPPDERVEPGQIGCYSHPIRTYALCEAFIMTKIKKLEVYAKRAAELVIKGQNYSGAWAYAYGKSPAAHTDLSVTGWNIQALKAAALTGIEISGLDESMDKAIAYVKRCQDKQGKFAYQEGRGGKASLTGTGVLSLQIWKNAKSDEADRGLQWIVQNEALKKEWSTIDLYGWYYNAQACFQAIGVSGGAKYWTIWNRAFQETICGNQAAEGYWLPAKPFHGDSNIFRTTLVILMLETYYRYMPTDSYSNIGK